MKAIKKLTKTAIATYVGISVSVAHAIEIKKPDFVKEVSADKLGEAGGVIEGYIAVFIGVMIALYAGYAGYLFISGETEKGVQHGKNILIGAVVAATLGGVTFLVLNVLN